MKNTIFKYLSSFLFTYPVEERKSEVSGKIEILYTNGRYVLDTAHVNYSFGGLHRVFQVAFSRLRIKKREIKNALILGFGGGSVASILRDEYKKDIKITGIEKDEVVIELAKKYFNAGSYNGLSLHCEDAYDFVRLCTEKFDLIAMDVFVDIDIPDKFSDDVFLAAVNNCLSDRGILFYNLVIYNEKIRDKGANLYKQMNRLMGNVEWNRVFIQRTENWIFVCDRTKISK